MKFLKIWRNVFFFETGRKRITRIIVCTFIIALIWIFADLLNGNLSFNPLHDLICLGLGVIGERIIPWGKSALGNTDKLKEQNVKLLASLKEANEMLESIDKNYTLVKK